MKNYTKTPVKVQKKSGFDKSFQNLFTSKVGTITPILCDEVIPNTTINLRAAITAALPPLASDTFMRVKLKYAAFFVPTRILFGAGSYEKWLTGDDAVNSATTIMSPRLIINSNDTTSDAVETKVCAVGTLADYLGIKVPKSSISGSTGATAWSLNVSALPFLGYHKIWNDWFRNSLVQKDIFNKVSYGNLPFEVQNTPYVAPTNASLNNYQLRADKKFTGQDGCTKFADGKLLTDLRQANFDIDMYTTASPEAQNGEAQSVSFKLTDENDQVLENSSFTISALRAANSIQQWLERNNIAGNRMVDYVKAQYGANLSDYIAQRPVLLGSGAFDVFSKGIYQTSTDSTLSGDSARESQNPFKSVASRYGSAFADGNDILINNFTAEEPGYIYVLCWLSPRVTYSTGVNPMLLRYANAHSQVEMANPILQNVGNEPINAREITGDILSTGDDTIFGYQDRYYSWKDRIDEVHGLLRDQESLQSFALQRTFTSGAPEISSEFLEIPTSYLDQVAAVSGDISKFGYWCDTYFDYKVSMPLAQYSVPSLQDPAYEHGVDVVVDTRGKQLS